MATDSMLVKYQRNGSPYTYNCVWKARRFQQCGENLELHEPKSYPTSVISHTALMEAYGMGKRYKNAEAIFRRMQSSRPDSSALIYQIILKAFVESNQFKEAEEVFKTLLDSEKSPLKPDQKMFPVITYMLRKLVVMRKLAEYFS